MASLKKSKKPPPKPQATKPRPEEPTRAAPAAQPPARATETLPTTGGRSAPQAAIKAAEEHGGGRGVSTDVGDNLVPLLYILQSNSPQCTDGDERQMDGARPGMLWLRGDTEPLVAGDEGLLLQPVHFYKEWQNWVKRKHGGGFLGRYPIDQRPKEAVRVHDEEKPNQIKYEMPDGSDIIECRVFVVNVWREGRPPVGYIVSLKSTGHSVGRQWMFMMNSKRLPGGAKPDAWSCLYHVTTKLRRNKSGTWYVLDPQDIIEDDEFAGWADDRQFAEGERLYQAFTSGALQADAPDDEAGGGIADEDDGAAGGGAAGEEEDV